MKKIKSIIPFVFIGLLLGSCGKDFLNSEPVTSKTDITYYTTAAEAEEALVGCYDALQLIYDDGIALTRGCRCNVRPLFWGNRLR